MPETLTQRLLALQPDEELIVPCAGRLEWKLVQNRVHALAQAIRQRRDAAFRVRTWGCTNGVGVERVLGCALLLLLASCTSRPAAAAAVAPTSDSVVTMPAGVNIPGRLAGVSQGVELWDQGDFTVRVRRVTR